MELDETLEIKKDKSIFVKEFKINNIKNNSSLDNNVLFRNGPAVIVINPSNLLKNNIFGKNVISYQMPIERSIDIDISFDFEIADLLLRKKKLLSIF